MKKAFLIGNFNYQYFTQLNGVENDINNIEKILKLKNYEIYKYKNLNFYDFLKFIQDENIIKENDEVIFYYAGHGLQVFDRFYFIPVDCSKNEIKNIIELDKQAIYLEDVVKLLSITNNVKVIIIDACRSSIIENVILSNNDIFNKGLFEVEKYDNFIISFATNSGNFAKETKYNGIYTKNLINYLKKYRLSVQDIFQKTRIDVMKETNCSQIPWDYSSLKEYYFLSNLSLNCVYKIPIRFNGIENICADDYNVLISTEKSITYINLLIQDYIQVQKSNNQVVKENINQPLVRNFSLKNRDEYVEKIKYYEEQFYITTNYGNLYCIDIKSIIKKDYIDMSLLPFTSYLPTLIFSLNKNIALFGLDADNDRIVISDENRNIYILQDRKIIQTFKCESDIYDMFIYNENIFCATYNGFYKIKDDKLIHLEKSKHLIIDNIYKTNQKLYFTSPNFVGIYDFKNDDIIKLFETENRIRSFCIYDDRFIIYWDECNILNMYDLILKEYIDKYKCKDINGNIYGINIIDGFIITRYDNNYIGFWEMNDEK